MDSEDQLPASLQFKLELPFQLAGLAESRKGKERMTAANRVIADEGRKRFIEGFESSVVRGGEGDNGNASVGCADLNKIELLPQKRESL